MDISVREIALQLLITEQNKKQDKGVFIVLHKVFKFFQIPSENTKRAFDCSTCFCCSSCTPFFLCLHFHFNLFFTLRVLLCFYCKLNCFCLCLCINSFPYMFLVKQFVTLFKKCYTNTKMIILIHYTVGYHNTKTVHTSPNQIIYLVLLIKVHKRFTWALTETTQEEN